MTTLRTIFAVIPSAQGAVPAVEAYRALPVGDRGKLVGLHVSPSPVSYGLGTDIALAAYLEAQIAAAEEEIETAKAAFIKACEQAGIPYEWRAAKALDDLVSPRAGEMARAADLILFPKLKDDASFGRHELEDLILAAGRPVLAIPEGWSGGTLGRSVIVAWDGGREAARAVFDAMPLLLQAKSVRIVSVQGFLDEPVRQFTPGDDIATTLSRHGIAAESLTFQSSRQSVKEELRAQMLDTGADLVVMGCYGHSRFREMVLGGVTREMLDEIPFPILLSN